MGNKEIEYDECNGFFVYVSFYQKQSYIKVNVKDKNFYFGGQEV